ncbi:DUF992 domain-containing protein [Hyphomicrobium sp. CS1GBMeth3]|uniref:DUF992 domain-containing protein n=1 Tax=Hyphomicrobium sp. CS1GBMeth3 TaxID=1892845 RepID=UPI000930AF6D|nr:DUF992 domain-containing protein [Hyphomicrobium sp. CS1GBMeth3]
MKTIGFVAAIAAAAAFCVSAPALSQPKFKAGTLTCTGGGGVGLILGSTKSYDCKYVSASGSYYERYTASITKIGLDVGVTNNSVMVWAVLAPSEVRKRGLAGSYAGATADIAIGIGGGAKVLLGGSNNSIALQPVSVQGQTGLNLAVGVAELSIR